MILQLPTTEKGLGESGVVQNLESGSIRDVVNSSGNASSTRPGRMSPHVQVSDGTLWHILAKGEGGQAVE